MSKDLDIAHNVATWWGQKFEGADFADMAVAVEAAVWLPDNEETLEVMGAKEDDDRYLWFAPTRSVMLVSDDQVMTAFRPDRVQRQYIREVCGG